MAPFRVVYGRLRTKIQALEALLMEHDKVVCTCHDFFFINLLNHMIKKKDKKFIKFLLFKNYNNKKILN